MQAALAAPPRGRGVSSILLRAVFPLLILAAGCRPNAPADRIAASGTLEMTEVYLSPTIPGRIETLTVREGDAVAAGQRVATFDRFAQAQRDYRRAERLLSAGGSTEQQVERAELALEDQQLMAPISAVVLTRVGEPGEVVAPGTPVLILGDPKEVYLEVYVSEGDIGRIRLGQAADILIDAFPDRRFAGRVTFVSPKAEFTPKNIQTKEERVTQMFRVKVTADAPEGFLKAGMPADCEIHTGRD
jgi:HlyD family secretion protein